MIRSDGRVVFVEVCKTGSTACAVLLRNHGWAQNGSRGRPPIPGTTSERHHPLTPQSRDYLDAEDIVAYGVVRNPWDRMASLWRASAPLHMDFLTYMQAGRFMYGKIDVMRFPQKAWLYGVDHVLRYENLAEELHAHRVNLDLHASPSLPAVNVSRRREQPAWTREERELVEQRFMDDIEAFGYTGPTEPRRARHGDDIHI